MRSYTNGPFITTGNVSPVQNMDPENGPSLIFQDAHLFDARQINSGAAPGLPGSRDYGIYSMVEFMHVNAVPQALSTTRLSAGQAVTAATPMTLVSAQGAGVSIAIPVQPWASGRAVKPQASTKVNTIALDFGFGTCTTVSGTPTVTNLPAGAWQFLQQPGQKVIIAGAGAGAALPLIAGILTPPAVNGTSMTLDTNAGQSASNLQIGTADPTGLVAWPYYAAGIGVAIADPSQLIGRAVSITGNAGSTAQNFVVAGYDIWGNPQTETIAFAGGAVTTNGKKAFKYIVSVTPATTDAGHTLSVGTTDIFGFTLRQDLFELADIFWNGALVTSNTGWVVADSATPTSTTGDTRGTYAVQSASDGTKRLIISSAVNPAAAFNASNLAFTTLFGNTPA